MTRKQIFWKLLAMVAIVGLLSVVSVMAADEATISGTIMESDQGFVLSTDDGETYMVQGQDVSKMVGKSVNVTGTLAESESGKIITVTKVEEISE